MYLQVHCKKAPSYSTGLIWVKKVGHYQLHKPKKQADDWIVIVDESIGIGQEKLLVVLGIRRRDIDFTRPLKMQDMTPLLTKSRESWKGADISIELERIKGDLGGIIYATTDSGNNIINALKASSINHVKDITHSIANILEKLYKKDDEFKSCCHQMGQMRFKNCCSKYAHLIPPNQRSKSRFLNIDIVSKWGMKVLNALDKNDMDGDQREQLLWMQQYRAFIIEMDLIITTIENISVLLKTNGLSKKSRNKCISLLKKCKASERTKLFRSYIIIYLDENIKQIRKRGEKLLCSSDIIETTFGKYKNEISKNLMLGISDLALIIPAYTANLSNENIIKAIDYLKVEDILKWKKENLCESLASKRNAVFKNVERN